MVIVMNFSVSANMVTMKRKAKQMISTLIFTHVFNFDTKYSVFIFL